MKFHKKVKLKAKEDGKKTKTSFTSWQEQWGVQ